MTCATCGVPLGAGCDMSLHRAAVKLWDAATRSAIQLGDGALASLCAGELFRQCTRWHALVDGALDQSFLDQGRHLPPYDRMPEAWQRAYDDHADGGR
jgi:hypothetical protein